MLIENVVAILPIVVTMFQSGPSAGPTNRPAIRRTTQQKIVPPPKNQVNTLKKEQKNLLASSNTEVPYHWWKVAIYIYSSTAVKYMLYKIPFYATVYFYSIIFQREILFFALRIIMKKNT